MLHHSDSDWRSVLNNRAAIRRHGMTWPFDHIRKDRTMTEHRRSSEEIRKAISAYTNEEPINPARIAEDTGIQLSTIASHLRSMGWEKARPGHWLREGTLIEHTEVPLKQPPVEPDPGARMSPPPAREFLDTVDSWEVKLTTSIAESTIGDLHKHYKAAGLRMEIRVWRGED